MSLLSAFLVIGLGLALRVTPALSGIELRGDAGSRYHPLASNIVAGNGFSKDLQPPYRPDDFDQPGYPLLVASVYWLAAGSKRAVVVVQLVLELIMLYGIFLTARRLEIPRGAVIIALSLGLVCPFLPMFSGRLLTEVAATFVACILCLLLIEARMGGRKVKWLMAGVAGGVSLLIRPDMLIGVVLMSLAAVVIPQGVSRREKWTGFLLFLLMSLLVLTPWTVRNYVVFRAFRPLGRVTEQVRLEYAGWLGTWLDDPKYVEPYWWQALDPNGVNLFPTMISSSQRIRAEQALQKARAQGSFAGEPDAEFARLTAEARLENPVSYYFTTRLRRAAVTWLRMPTYVINFQLKILAYVFWLGLLGFSVIGVLVAWRRRMWNMLIPFALIVGRTALPLSSGLAAEPRYMLECLPACLLLAGLGLHGLTLRFRMLVDRSSHGGRAPLTSPNALARNGRLKGVEFCWTDVK